MAERNAATSPAAIAATSSAVRPTLNVASASDTEAGSLPRDSSVDVRAVGTHTTIDGSRPSGTRTARPPETATTPP